MFNKKMIKFIDKAMKLDILNICTKDGYAKADILTISSYNKSHLDIMKSYIEASHFQVSFEVIKKTPFNNLIQDKFILHCVFSEDKIDNEIIELKEVI